MSATAILEGAPPPFWPPCRYTVDGSELTLLWFRYDAHSDSYEARISKLAIVEDVWGSMLSPVEGARPDAHTLIEVLADLDGKRQHAIDGDELAQLWTRRAA